MSDEKTTGERPVVMIKLGGMVLTGGAAGVVLLVIAALILGLVVLMKPTFLWSPLWTSERRGEERLTCEGLGIHFISPAAPKPAQPRAAAPLPPAPGAQDTVAAGPRVHRAGGRRTAGPLRTSRGLGPALSGTSLEWSHHREGRPRAGALGALPARPASDL